MSSSLGPAPGSRLTSRIRLACPARGRVSCADDPGLLPGGGGHPAAMPAARTVSLCQVPGCDQATVGRGFCRLHYQRVRATGDPGPLGAYPRARDLECTIEGCDRPQDSRGWCAAHYERWRATGDPLPRPKPPTTPRFCAVDGCPRTVTARGWCARHYNRWVRTGDPGPADLLPRGPSPSATGCSVDGCHQLHHAKGLCAFHYQRVRKTGATDDPTRYPELCTVPGCTREHRCKGFCARHYERWRTSGDPGPADLDTPKVAPGCVVPGCDQPHYARSWCQAHYGRWRRGGVLEAPFDALQGAQACTRGAPDPTRPGACAPRTTNGGSGPPPVRRAGAPTSRSSYDRHRLTGARGVGNQPGVGSAARCPARAGRRGRTPVAGGVGGGGFGAVRR